ncbi:bifunctional tRNA (5-methylaminomethyl-2-thiouridine)(34)-methyltransferase MnmD/FAD-dependent 5-carboxymethylaminomethyl-2-thiouridine(34) oxidoreductase MnmC [Pseudomonas oryzihabitans]|uniref:bifunctional tRNA (5-methylaminomethyl-2-thiouridine)(34)-methyltransferase MnmD/FAD-dependent 5-carboxymethylaminomethyl-2-thiouridine(34) oxidoreductase MnmC n=1 Tax=Pseudomonas oryzihabitans TaxID=47885 RepID=UPI0015E3CEA5|nr:bifunctional tRNA (5-methylaminomethyl-2-thiouridine)(34)-methyltransferase MnmD/FAD-dependent 5-carboxymethylaminomethyl-2-thiouridine(34) oxidoreductase MnmC [Pseudomonas psychrotolerans]MBA1213203.1 bifunctional tRNA (5-methylaminomethyl-2-thiouridine)(34)-methyltransferase MnmD/FAD-dependent 5-carboxymethylaminomethyl-2-thiouridine(34) oxidoreductase MnmC [Pseudomonas psychrotolerans]
MTDFQHAQLDWDASGQPLSRTYGDVYFSRASGLEETRYVFLQQNRLAERFAALAPGEVFTIGETGFGTGLNFLCAWQLFDALAPGGARLHFVSVERFPLTAADLAQALDLWPELAAYSGALQRQYQAIHPGFQRLILGDGRITLTLLVGDVLERLPELDARCDAWFLDGFAPAKNPEMWTPTLFAELARLSHAGTTLTTFTCAGFVRRGLNEAGFAMAKVPGFGHKREMLAGKLERPVAPTLVPWYARPPRPQGPRTALVIGAGLAGCATAASLARRGWQVRVVERHGAPAQEASGNPQGVLYLKLSAHDTPLSRLILDGFGLTLRELQALPPGAAWSPCGVLQLALTDKDAQRQAQLAAHFPADLLQSLDRDAASDRAGIGLTAGGLFFPEGGWVHPPALCAHWLTHPNIELVTHTEVTALQQTEHGWQARTLGAPLAATVVVVASAAQARTLLPGLPLKAIRGQLSALSETPDSQALATVVCGEGYLAPARDGRHCLGASFVFDRDDTEPSQTEHQSNLQLLAELSPGLAASYQAEALDGRVAFRCTSPDYLPLVGPVVDEDLFAQRYQALAYDARQVPEQAAPWRTGLYVNLAHGSRGLVTTPAAAELLAAWLEDEPLPVARRVAEACHPSRFPLRRLIRGG